MSIPYLRDWEEALETVAAITGVVIVFMFPPPGPSLEGSAVAWPQFASFVGAFGVLYLKSIVQKQIAPSLANRISCGHQFAYCVLRCGIVLDLPTRTWPR